MADRAIQIERELAAQLASRLTDDVRQAAADAQPHWAAVARNRGLLKDEQPRATKPWESACELVVPYVKEAKFALLSHFCPTLLGSEPIFHVEGVDDAGKAGAESLERFLQAQLSRQVGFRRAIERLFDAALRDGTGIAHVYWDTRQQRRPVFERISTAVVDPASGAVLHAAGSVVRADRLQVSYDAPRVDIIPVERFSTFPAANADIQASPGVFVRVAVTGEEILQRMHRGEFDRTAVETMRSLAADTDTQQSADSLQRRIEASPADQAFRTRSFTLTEMYYRYTPRTESDEPAGDWLITLHEPSGTLLQARPSPWFHQRRPFIAISPYQDVEGFYGDSLASAGAGHVQMGKTLLLRLAVDAAAIGIHPEMLVSMSLGNHISDIKKRRGPGGVIPFPDAYFENNSTKMQPFGSNGYQPTLVIPLMQMLDREGQQATGVSDTLKGIPNPGNVTATEATQIMESSQKILAFLNERLADGIAEIGHLIYELNYQFQGNDGPQRLWGELFPPSASAQRASGVRAGKDAGGPTDGHPAQTSPPGSLPLEIISKRLHEFRLRG